MITVSTQESSTFLTSPKLTLCSSRGFWKRKEHILLLRTHSLHLLPPRNSESSKLMCSHFWLLSPTSCNLLKVEMKILHKRSKTSIVRLKVLPPCSLWSTDIYLFLHTGTQTQGKCLFLFQECLLHLDKSYYHQVPFYWKKMHLYSWYFSNERKSLHSPV